MRSSINHTSMVAALELCRYNKVTHKHGKAVEELAKMLLRVPGHTLGEHVPEANRLIPPIQALERAGIIKVDRKGTRVFSIALTGKHKDYPVMDDSPEKYAAQIIEVLALQGGKLEDPKGFASTELIARLNDGASKKAWQHRINQAEEQGWITRDARNSRTYSIQLTPLGMEAAGLALPGWQASEPTPEPVPQAQPEPAPVEVLADPEPEVEPEIFEVLMEDDEVFHAVSVLMQRVHRTKILEQITLERDQLQDEVVKLKDDRRELQELLSTADKEIDRYKRQAEELQQIADRLGHDRDEWRRRYNAILDTAEDVKTMLQRPDL